MFKKIMFFVTLFAGLVGTSFAQIPESWQQEWDAPGADCRPLQIIHGYYGVNKAKWAHPYLAFGHFDGKTIAEGMAFLKNDCGLGGVVCNVSSWNYLQDDEEWAHFVEAVRQAKANGLRVWIYDEDRYPSLAAGGLVLKENPRLEAKELVYDPTQENPFTVRDCFEFTHASNNFAYIRRYPSMPNPDACRAFLRLTHENYKKHLGPELFDYVEAFFTDEPSTNAVCTGLLLKKVRDGVRTIDTVDPQKKILPQVIWEDDFPEIYRQKYGEDLLACRQSLFTGDTPHDRKVRRQFWSMVAQRCIETYYGAIRDWCVANGKASSGHTLWEESLFAHVPLDGDKLAVLRTLNIPGMDFLNSDPEAAIHQGWRAATMSASASALTGERRSFSEISDINTYFNGKPRATAPMMCAAAAWQAAFGITEFTLYYQITDRTPADYRQYCDFVGRVNAILRKAQFTKDVVVLYPIRNLQENYIPQGQTLTLKVCTDTMRKICDSYNAIGKKLVQSQTPFLLAEETDFPALLAGKLGGLNRPRVVILPDGCDLLPESQKILDAFVQSGGKVFYGDYTPESVLTPANEKIIRGTFLRDGHPVQILVNVSNTDVFTGTLAISGTTCTLLDPATGTQQKADAPNGRLPLTLQPWQTLLIVE
ncbi:MAG: hypothetical protein Q4D98_12945 [Planctomycetia bacterium]|nr:hypothetical protein [Planctomycetia bacterium]